MKEKPPLPRCERRDLRLTSVVVQSSDPRWMAAPHRPHEPDLASRQDQPTTGRPAVPPKDGIVGRPDEFLIDLPDFPDRALNTVAPTQWDS